MTDYSISRRCTAAPRVCAVLEKIKTHAHRYDRVHRVYTRGIPGALSGIVSFQNSDVPRGRGPECRLSPGRALVLVTLTVWSPTVRVSDSRVRDRQRMACICASLCKSMYRAPRQLHREPQGSSSARLHQTTTDHGTQLHTAWTIRGTLYGVCMQHGTARYSAACTVEARALSRMKEAL